MGIGLLVSFVGVLVAALAGVLGVWMERDPKASVLWGMFFSFLIAASSGVELIRTAALSVEQSQVDAQLANLLGKLGELSANNPDLEQFVSAELAVQARANPGVVSRMEDNVRAAGGDPASVRRKAAEGRRSAAGMSRVKGVEDKGARKQDRPAKAEKKKAAEPEAPAAATATAIASEIPGPAGDAAAKAAKDADAALRAAQQQAQAQIAAAEAQAAEITAKAEALQAKATQAMAQAEKVQKQADAALKDAKAQLDAGLKAADSIKGDASKKAGKAADKIKGGKLPGF